jgi:hypothetical protein
MKLTTSENVKNYSQKILNMKLSNGKKNAIQKLLMHNK